MGLALALSASRMSAYWWNALGSSAGALHESLLTKSTRAVWPNQSPSCISYPWEPVPSGPPQKLVPRHV